MSFFKSAAIPSESMTEMKKTLSIRWFYDGVNSRYFHFDFIPNLETNLKELRNLMRKGWPEDFHEDTMIGWLGKYRIFLHQYGFTGNSIFRKIPNTELRV